MPPGLRLFPIVVQGHPWDLKVTISTEEYGKPFLYCEGTCDAWAYEGEYWITVRSTPHTAAGRRRIQLSETSKLDVRAQPRNQRATTTTAGLIFLGSGVGLVTLALLTTDRSHDDEDGRATPSLLFLGGALSTVAGLVLLMVGGTRDTTIPDVDITED